MWGEVGQSVGLRVRTGATTCADQCDVATMTPSQSPSMLSHLSHPKALQVYS